MKAILLAGGEIKGLVLEPGDSASSKGMVKVCGLPLAWRSLQALREAKQISEIILVGGDHSWEGVTRAVAAHNTLMDSFNAGLEACQAVDGEKILVCCGDQPFLRGEILDDFISRCLRHPDTAIWYGYLCEEVVRSMYPQQKHTWAKFQDGTFCGSGVMMLRADAQVLNNIKHTMLRLTKARKNLFLLVTCFGWKNIFRLLTRRLTVAYAEKAAQELFHVLCAAVETPYAELSFNVDDATSLNEARRILQEVGDTYANRYTHR